MSLHYTVIKEKIIDAERFLLWNSSGNWYKPDGWRFDLPPEEQQSDRLAVFSYKNEDHFRYLWGLDGKEGIFSILKGLDRWAKELTVVIVWDGMPDGGPGSGSVHSFVGPYDWALALSWGIYGFGGNGEPNVNVKLRVFILDARTERESSFATRLISSQLDLLPWIQGYQVISPDWNVEMFMKDLSESMKITTHGDSSLRDRTRDAVGLTRDLWYQTLLKVENRHSVANQIAPWLLTEGLPQELQRRQLRRPSVVHKALHSILRYSNLLKEGEEFQGRSIAEEIRKISCVQDIVFQRRNQVKFMLVDDHYALGYDNVLGCMLFGREYDPTQWSSAQYQQGDRRLECAGSLGWIYEHLKKYKKTQLEYEHKNGDQSGLWKKWWKQPRRLFEGKCDVLFLDLRFWDNDTGRQEVMEKLVAYAESLHVKENPDEDIQFALEAAKTAIGEGGGFPLEALTLLPLLLSHLDRTLPIILFSSSHQRAVSEMLRHRRNIITNFAKPMISGYGEKIPLKRSIYALASAVNKALDLHESRIVWERICAWHKEIQHNNGQLRFREQPIECTFTEDDCLHLAYLFETYIIGELFHEFLDRCWVFLERNIRKNPDRENIENLNFYVWPEIDGDAGSKLAYLLKTFRNNTLHGDWDRDSFQIGEQNQVRHVALLLFLYLFTYLYLFPYLGENPVNVEEESVNRHVDYNDVPLTFELNTPFFFILKAMINEDDWVHSFNNAFHALDQEVAYPTSQLLNAHSLDVQSRTIYANYYSQQRNEGMETLNDKDMEAEKQALNAIFSTFGEVTRTNVCLNSNGYTVGFVNMQNSADMEEALGNADTITYVRSIGNPRPDNWGNFLNRLAKEGEHVTVPRGEGDGEHGVKFVSMQQQDNTVDNVKYVSGNYGIAVRIIKCRKFNQAG